jgi:hypothetical protein
LAAAEACCAAIMELKNELNMLNFLCCVECVMYQLRLIHISQYGIFSMHFAHGLAIMRMAGWGNSKG